MCGLPCVSQGKSSYQLLRVLLLWLLAPTDLVATVLLGGFGIWHARMLFRGRTSLGPRGEEHFDLGAAANARQVLGRRPALWLLPVWWGDGPEGDGLVWPRRPGAPPLVSFLRDESLAGDEDDWNRIMAHEHAQQQQREEPSRHEL